MSIFLEAIQRFVEPTVVSNPKLVLIVGCFGLLSNILGLFLFHEHGHSHGGGGHSHGEEGRIGAAEEGHSHGALNGADGATRAVADEGGNIADVLPQSTIGGWPTTSTSQDPRGFSKSDEDESTAAGTTSPVSMRKTHSHSNSNSTVRRHRRRTSASRGSRLATVDDIHVHPASFRNEIIAASRLEDIESGTGTESEGEEAVVFDGQEDREDTPLLGKDNDRTHSKHRKSVSQDLKHAVSHNSWHVSHNHSQPKKDSGKGGHSDLNMRGVFLHVMGDALGNIGVIASALIIWLTDYWWKYYSDPAISLVITLIILGSAIPLCRAASRILLQAVPAGINVDEVKQDIEELPGILSCHHLHVWQLSDTKLVASLHVQIEFDFKGEGSARYMQLAKAVRHCLHGYGIHSSTIQPEFCLDSEHNHTSGPASVTGNQGNGETSRQSGSLKISSRNASRAGSMRSTQDACLLECGDECEDERQCCAPGLGETDNTDHGHSH
jgi:zinc transporter 1